MKKVSVIIPVYKAEYFLDKCVSSIINQTYENLEIILVDDGSPDNSPKMCDEWAQKDKRIKVIHKENGGASSARNKGLEDCTGDYIYFCDSDDFIEINCIEKLVDKIKDNDVVIMGYNKVNGDKITAKVYNDKLSQNEFISEIIHEWDFGLLWNKLYKKEFIKSKFNEKFKIREDLLFNSEYFKNVKKIGLINEPLYNYIDNPNSLTKGAKTIPFEQLKTIHLNMLELLNQIDESIVPHQNATYLKSFINILKPFVYSKLKKEDKELVFNYLEDDTIKESFKNYKTINLKESIFIFLLKHKKIKLLLFFIKLMR